MYSSDIQRYFNEHVHLPFSFFIKPERFMRHILKKKGAFMETAYNYIEPSEEDTDDVVEYHASDFDVMSGTLAGRQYVQVLLPEPTMPLHCKMIGCSVKANGRYPIWRTLELTEQGFLLLCGWTADHSHYTIDVVDSKPELFIPQFRKALIAPEEFKLASLTRLRDIG